nr:LytTR family transcriptional regulator DNA-binding domain-containing protein [Maribacter sp.]
MQGTITDTGKAQLSLANIIIYEVGNKEAITGVVSNEEGSYKFKSIKDGKYIIEVSVLGFETKKSDEFQLARANFKVDFTLKEETQNLDKVVVKVSCPIIFCSAHDDYLFEAFNTNGIAYILKPYSADDFSKALEKYQSLFKQSRYSSDLNNKTLKALKIALQEEQAHYKKRFVIKRPKGIQLLNTSEISMIEASGDFCIAVDQEGKRHPISQTIGSITEQLPPKKFFRINRSEMVHMDFIEEIESYFKNRLLISIKGCTKKVMTSSSTTSDFRKWLE